jgi:hypothetical protein
MRTQSVVMTSIDFGLNAGFSNSLRIDRVVRHAAFRNSQPHRPNEARSRR